MSEPVKFERICPCCGDVLNYSRRDSLNEANKYNKNCRKCSDKQRRVWNRGLTCETSEKVHELTEKMRISKIGKKRNPKVTQKILASRKGYRHSIHTIEKISKANKGKIRTEETKKKLSLAAIRRIQKYKIYNKPNFNPTACRYIDRLNDSFGINLLHALNGGEVWISGFYPDGYDKKLNIIFEYDEPWHNNKRFKKYDKQKQNNLITTLGECLFIRYDEKENRLYDAVSDQTISVAL